MGPFGVGSESVALVELLQLLMAVLEKKELAAWHLRRASPTMMVAIVIVVRVCDLEQLGRALVFPPVCRLEVSESHRLGLAIGLAEGRPTRSH